MKFWCLIQITEKLFQMKKQEKNLEILTMFKIII